MRPWNVLYVLGCTKLTLVSPVSIGTPFTSVLVSVRNVGPAAYTSLRNASLASTACRLGAVWPEPIGTLFNAANPACVGIRTDVVLGAAAGRCGSYWNKP